MYNAESYLDRLISSLLKQTLSEMEFIFINDGSIDRSKEIVEKYLQRDSRIKLINNKNNGVSSARNDGMMLASGKYIAFVDSDDFVSEKMYECLYNKAEERQADIVSCGYIVYQNGQEIPVTTAANVELNQKEALKDILENKFLGMSVWNKLFLKDVIKGVCFEKKYRINEDRYFLFNAVRRASNILIIPDTLYYYRANLDSVSHTRFNPVWMDMFYVANDMKTVVDREYKDLSHIAEATVARSSYVLLFMIYRDNVKEQYKDEYNILIDKIKRTKLLNVKSYVGIRRLIQMFMIKYFEGIYSRIKTCNRKK